MIELIIGFIILIAFSCPSSKKESPYYRHMRKRREIIPWIHDSRDHNNHNTKQNNNGEDWFDGDY